MSMDGVPCATVVRKGWRSQLLNGPVRVRVRVKVVRKGWQSQLLDRPDRKRRMSNDKLLWIRD